MPSPPGNPELWLKADSTSGVEGFSVSSLADSSGNGHTATQSDAAKRPTWHTVPGVGPGLLFDGTNDFMAIDPFTTGTEAATILAVVSSTAVSGNRTVINLAKTALFRSHFSFGSLRWGVFAGTALQSATGLVGSSPILLAARVSTPDIGGDRIVDLFTGAGAGEQFCQACPGATPGSDDGLLCALGAYDSGFGTGYTELAPVSEPFEFHKGYIHEVVVYLSGLSDPLLQLARFYMGTKWGVAAPAAPFGPATYVAITGYSSPAVAGVSDTFTAAVKDADDATVLNFEGTVAFGSSDANATIPADYTFDGSEAGEVTLPATFRTSGFQTIGAVLL